MNGTTTNNVKIEENSDAKIAGIVMTTTEISVKAEKIFEIMTDATSSEEQAVVMTSASHSTETRGKIIMAKNELINL